MIRAQHVIANLDCELSWLELASRDPALADLGVPIAKRTLSGEAARRIGPLATLLRALCTDDAPVLWTPFDVDPACLVEVQGLPLPRIERGVDGAPHDALEWGATRDVDAARVAARCNHRRFGFELARELGANLDESSWIDDVGRLDEITLPSQWVLKAPLSAAGRDRVIGTDVPSEEQRNRIDGLIARQGPLLLEPWMERSVDFACFAIVGDDADPKWHVNGVDDHGRFGGVGIPIDGNYVPPPPSAQVAERVRDALYEAGYRGPYGVDAYMSPVEPGFHSVTPLCEINARLTFGAVARALFERLEPPPESSPASMSLWIGRGEPTPADTEIIQPLVRPTEHSDTSAWLQWA